LLEKKTTKLTNFYSESRKQERTYQYDNVTNTFFRILYRVTLRFVYWNNILYVWFIVLKPHKTSGFSTINLILNPKKRNRKCVLYGVVTINIHSMIDTKASDLDKRFKWKMLNSWWPFSNTVCCTRHI